MTITSNDNSPPTAPTLSERLALLTAQTEGLASALREVQKAAAVLEAVLTPAAVVSLPGAESEPGARPYTYKTRMEAICAAQNLPVLANLRIKGDKGVTAIYAGGDRVLAEIGEETVTLNQWAQRRKGYPVSAYVVVEIEVNPGTWALLDDLRSDDAEPMVA